MEALAGRARRRPSPSGLRDRAMLELLYASGLRVTELVDLKPPCAWAWPRACCAWWARAAKERLVPFGAEAQDWIERYLRRSPGHHLEGGQVSEALFVTARGGPMTRQMFWTLVKRHARSGQASRCRLSPHTLRHAFATHSAQPRGRSARRAVAAGPCRHLAPPRSTPTWRASGCGSCTRSTIHAAERHEKGPPKRALLVRAGKPIRTRRSGRARSRCPWSSRWRPRGSSPGWSWHCRIPGRRSCS